MVRNAPRSQRCPCRACCARLHDPRKRNERDKGRHNTTQHHSNSSSLSRFWTESSLKEEVLSETARRVAGAHLFIGLPFSFVGDATQTGRGILVSKSTNGGDTGT